MKFKSLGFIKPKSLVFLALVFFSLLFILQILFPIEETFATLSTSKVERINIPNNAVATINGERGLSLLNYGINQDGGDPNWAEISMNQLRPFFSQTKKRLPVNITQREFSKKGSLTVADGFTLYGYINDRTSGTFILDKESFPPGVHTIDKPSWYLIILAPTKFNASKLAGSIPNPTPDVLKMVTEKTGKLFQGEYTTNLDDLISILTAQNMYP